MMRSLACLVLAASTFGCTGEAPSAATGDGNFSLIDNLDHADASFDETQFRSTRKDGRLVNAVTINGRTELSLTPPLPSTFRYRLRVPEDPVLRFATGVATAGEKTLSFPIELSIKVSPTGDDTETEVFSNRVRRRAAHQWRDHDVDLSPWAGQEIELVLSSRWRTERQVSLPVIASWGNPVIASRLEKQTHRPDIVLVSIDCLRADHVGAYGYGRATTPAIDRVAEDGVVFDNAFATASWTLPAHMSMLTGLLPSFHGATKWEKLSSSVPYLPELLAEAGYRTSGVVSWVYLSQTYGFERGYHTYRVLDDPEASDIVDVAIEELERGEGQPRFLFVHVYDPHWPYLPPDELIEAFGPRPRDISNLIHKTANKGAPDDAAEIEEVRRLYDSEVSFADRELGRFFEALETRGAYDDALIIVTADHGEAFYEHGHWQHSQTLYDELTHIPMIVKWPEGGERGRSSELRSQMDVFVTILEAAGVEPDEVQPGFLERRSLGADAEGPRTVLSEVTWRSPSGASLKVSFRDDELKYVATLSGPSGDDLGVNQITSEELYELTSDPGETKNLLPGDDDRAQRFRADLRAFLEQARAARSLRSGEAVELDDATKRKLESLGYTH